MKLVIFLCLQPRFLCLNRPRTLAWASCFVYEQKIGLIVRWTSCDRTKHPGYPNKTPNPRTECASWGVFPVQRNCDLYGACGSGETDFRRCVFFCHPVFPLSFIIALLFLLGWHQRKRDLLQVGQIKTLIARIVVGMLGLSTWFNAVIYLPISLATVLAQTMTIFITILAPLMLAETVGPRRIAAVLFGFVGVVVLVNPMADSPVLAVAPVGLFFGLAAPFFAALMFIYLRKLGTSEAPISTTLWYNLAGTLVFFILALADGLPMPDIAAENQFIWFVLIFTVWPPVPSRL